MVFSKKNAGKWVASRNGEVLATSVSLLSLLKRMGRRVDKKTIWYDKIPPAAFAGGSYGV
ncbi:MAG: hypothetical protein AAB728_04365 [Patescibacteria group bacterium]